MEPEAPKKEELQDLASVLEQLRSDAKSLVKDLLEGVELWKRFSNILICVSLLGFFLVYVVIFPRTLAIPYIWTEIIAALIIGGAALFGAIQAYIKFYNLRKKYKLLFEASKRLK